MSGEGIGYLSRERSALGADAFSPATSCGLGRLLGRDVGLDWFSELGRR